MSTFFGFLLFSPFLALFFGFVAWFAPALVFPDQVAKRRPRLFGYLVTGYAILGVLVIYLLLTAGHYVAPILGTACSFSFVLFLRQRSLARGGRRAWSWPWSRAREDDEFDGYDAGDQLRGQRPLARGPDDPAWPGRPGPSARRMDDGLPDTDPM